MINGPRDHINAKPVIAAAWRAEHKREPSGQEALYTQAIAALETGYGRLGQFAAMANNGLFNWGGVQKQPNADGSCPVGYAPGVDQGNVCFRVFTNDIDAARTFIWELTVNPSHNRSSVLAAMNGNAQDVATAMRKTGYYGGELDQTEDQKIAYYTAAIRSRANEIITALQNAGQSLNASVEGKTGISTGKLLVLGGLIGGGIWGIKKYKKG